MTDKATAYEPRVIVFACNWCSYAGADTAGINRVKYSPHVRVVRTMCSGRVHPAFVIRAFEKGADGILVTGCHPGDCHYISGNNHAVENFEIVKNLTSLIGIEEDRIGLEWVSGAEGGRFGQLMNDFVGRVAALGPLTENRVREQEAQPAKSIDEIARELDTLLCYECGKCTSVCPVSRTLDGFSPRRTIRSRGQSLNGQSAVVDDCLSCALCDYRCPQDVQIAPFVAAMRAANSKPEDWGERPHGGIFQAMGRMMARPEIRMNRKQWLPEDLRTGDDGDTLLYVGCAPFHDAYFPQLGVKNLESIAAAIRILNYLGIDPIVLDDERCCGHDAYWEGDEATFRKLAEMNRDRIMASGAKRVVFTCPECRYAVQELYERAGIRLPLELKGITEIIAENAYRLNLESVERKVTFQDPCRMARYLGDTDSPRTCLEQIPGTVLAEMPRSRSASICCAGNWHSCGSLNKMIQGDRLDEAKSTGAGTLVTACPKCEIHLKCALKGREESDLEIRDLTVLVAEALPGAKKQTDETEEVVSEAAETQT